MSPDSCVTVITRQGHIRMIAFRWRFLNSGSVRLLRNTALTFNREEM